MNINWGVAQKWTRTNKEGEGVKTWESWVNVLFERPLSVKTVASSVPTVLSLDNGDTITNPYGIANSFNNYFTSIGETAIKTWNIGINIFQAFSNQSDSTICNLAVKKK